MNRVEKLSARERHLAFAGLWAASIAVFRAPLRAIAILSWTDDRYSHLLLIPAISLFLLYLERVRVFSRPEGGRKVAFGLLLGSGLIYYGSFAKFGPQEHLSLAILATVLAWAGIFALSYGAQALWAAVFPFGFLVFMIPIPEGALNWMVHGLQSASADVSAVLFRAIGMPSYRRGFRFLLPGVEIEVASECSGIRSTITLVLVSVLAAHALLRSASRRILLVAAAIPVGIFKNAVRIVALSYLGVYVDRAFLEGKIHHEYGGLVFSSLSLLLAIPLLIGLRRSEARQDTKKSPA